MNNIVFRSFQNSDPPTLVALCQHRPPLRGLLDPMSVDTFGRYVLGKPYFDREGLIVACAGSQVVGFVHAGFGPNEDRSAINPDVGIVCMLVLEPTLTVEVGCALVERAEAYLRHRGARILQGGGFGCCGPFYRGLYGGSALPGVLIADQVMASVLASSGYSEKKRCLLWQRDLSGFGPPVDRVQIQHRRTCVLEAVVNIPPTNWWDACDAAFSDQIQFQLRRRDGGPLLGTADFWDMHPMATVLRTSTVGLRNVEIAPPFRREGLATLLLSEALRYLETGGVERVQVQFDEDQQAARRLFTRLQFVQVDQGIVFEKLA